MYVAGKHANPVRDHSDPITQHLYLPPTTGNGRQVGTGDLRCLGRSGLSVSMKKQEWPVTPPPGHLHRGQSPQGALFIGILLVVVVLDVSKG